MESISNSTYVVKIQTIPNMTANFLNWQSKFRSQISQASGFSSLEIQTPFPAQSNTWLLSLRFASKKYLDSWLKSSQYTTLLNDLISENIVTNQHSISEENSSTASNSSGVTEIYVTLVDKTKLMEFHEWREKIHKIESTFPGFQKVFVQAPDPGKTEGAWITLLQFDRLDNLENWLSSPQRKAMLKESEGFVNHKETHQLLSSFGGWFNESPLPITPRWKQTMLILVVLYPIVMTQYLYLADHLTFLGPSLKTFVENVICVSLLSWPLLPMVIYILKWWLELKSDFAKNLLGCGILLLAYAIEIMIFFKLSKG